MKLIGAALWAFGVLLFLYAALGFDPSIRTYSSVGPDRIVNLDRQQTQMLIAMAGLTCFLAGAIVHALAHLSQRDADGTVNREPRTPRSRERGGAGGVSLGDAEAMARHGIRPGDDGAQV